MYGRSFPSLCQLYFSLHFGVQTEILSKNQNSNLGLNKKYGIEIKNPISGKEYFDLLEKLKNESFTRIS